MTRSGRVRLLLVCATAALMGCGGGRGIGARGRPQTASRPWALPVFNRVEVPLPAESAPRGSFAPDVAKIPSWSEVERALGSAAPSENYLHLSTTDCLLRAAETAPVVELLHLERAMAEQVVRRGYDSGGKLAPQVRLLSLRIDERRSRAAAEAVTRLHQLADVQVQRQTAAEIVHEIDELLAAAEKIERVTGNAVPERRDLAVRQAEALDELAKLAAQGELLDDQLRVALAMEAGDERRIWPVVATNSRAEPIDLEEAIVLAHEKRTELATLRLVSETLSADTLGMARSLLAQEDGGLGTVATPAEAVRSQVGTYEVGVRRKQLAAALAGGEERIAAEVRAAASEVESAMRHVARAKEVRAQRVEARRLLELEVRFDRATRFTLGAANIGALNAEAQLRHEILELRQAEIRLSTATGTLLD